MAVLNEKDRADGHNRHEKRVREEGDMTPHKLVERKKASDGILLLLTRLLGVAYVELEFPALVRACANAPQLEHS